MRKTEASAFPRDKITKSKSSLLRDNYWIIDSPHGIINHEVERTEIDKTVSNPSYMKLHPNSIHFKFPRTKYNSKQNVWNT